MSDLKVHEAENGDMQYYDKTMTCQCCKKTMVRTKFVSKETSKHDGMRIAVCKSICNKCRKTIVSAPNDVKWNKRGDNAEGVSRPSIIDLMESYRDR